MDKHYNVEEAENYSELNRRQFLTKSGLGILGTSLASSFSFGASRSFAPPKTINPNDTIPVKLPNIHAETEKKEGPLPTPLSPEKKIRYALVGLGHLTLEQLLPAFSQCKYSSITALVSGDPAKAAKVAGQYGISEKSIYNYTNFDTIKDNKEIDVVYIVLPNSMHEEFTIRAANAGKHVLCEKPMATSSASAQRMVDACKKANRKLMIAYRIQFEPMNRTVMHWVRNKQYGNVKIIDMFNGQNIGDPNQWRLNKKLSGGGALPDIGIYCFNTARFLTGEEPESVSGLIYSSPGDARFKEVEETVMFNLHFPSGILVKAGASYGVHQIRRYTCLAEKGSFGMDPAFPYNGLKMEVDQAREKIEWKQHPYLGEKNQFSLEIDHMSLCVIDNKQPYTPGEEGVQDCKITEAIYDSAASGKSVKLQALNKQDSFRGTPPKE